LANHTQPTPKRANDVLALITSFFFNAYATMFFAKLKVA